MPKDDATWLNVAYIAFGALSAFFLFKAFELVGLQTGILEAYEWFNPASTVGAIIGGAALAFFIKSSPERHDYYLSSIGELRKVAWPTWPDTKRMTLIVVVVVSIFAVIVSIFDIFWAKALRLLIA